ncbi:cytochrome P450 76A2-like [Papaver somniferum]|uniref:cytochrome P450 76A2-like n=1 Tax=Papaver somniferum TaxID=3469 RepID=UPI000E703B89|nr:cytochrome P450 76A2-like [Papaver somniferum]
MSTDDMFIWTAISIAVAAPLLLLLLHSFLCRKNKTKPRRLPPGPSGWPLIGNLFHVGYDYNALHKRLVGIQKKYGPIFMIRVGWQNMLVIASADAAMELFKTHDQAFFNRQPIQTLQLPDDDIYQLTPWASYGPIWRINRRLYASLFSRTTMNSTLGKRRQFLDQIIEWLLAEEKEGRSVEIKHLTLVAFANLFGNLFFSKDVMDLKSASGNKLYQLLEEIVVVSSKPNVADVYPWLRNLDPQNLASRMKKAQDAFVNIIDEFAKERKSRDTDWRNNKEEKDYWDLLMDFEGNGKDEPMKLSDRYINFFITEIFIAGIDSIITPLEWVMTEVMRNPEVMRKAKDEIAQVVGYNKKIEESDVESLPYLGSVIKETLRLHPPAPMLIPRTIVEDTEFMGYIIPKDTAVLVNFWSIGRDSDLWDDPLSFNPDRFIGNNTDYRGQHSQFLPFGAGRRMCAGLPLVHQILPIVVGSLLQSFDWTLETGVTPESIDMDEKIETSLKKSIPLRIIPRASVLAV